MISQRPLRRSAGARQRRSTWSTRFAAFAVLLGAVLDLRQYAAGRSLWQDEAMLAYSVIHDGYRALFAQPLTFDQSAPAGFLVVQRAIVTHLGVSAYTLRVFPLLAGLGTLALSWFLARRLLTPAAAVAALLLVAASPQLIYYASEAKQYAVETCAVLAVVALAVRALDRPRSTRWLVAWAVVGAGAVWFADPVIFALVGTAAVLAARAIGHRQWRRLATVAASSLLWGVSFLLDYRIVLSAVPKASALQAFWAKTYPPQPLTAGGMVSWLGRELAGLSAVPLHWSVPPLVAALLAVGTWVLVRRHGWVGAVPVTVVAVATGAAATRHYPLAVRLALYLVPLFSLSVAAVVDLGTGRRGVRVLGAGLLAVIGFGAASSAVSTLGHPIELVDSRAVYREVADHWRPGDVLVVTGQSLSTYLYYRARFRLPPAVMLTGGPPAGCGSPAQEQLVAARRIWFGYAYHPSWEPPAAPALDVARLAALPGPGTRALLHRSFVGGAQVWLLPAARAAAGRCAPVATVPIPPATAG